MQYSRNQESPVFRHGECQLAENSMMEKVKKFGVDGFKGVASSIATQFLGGI